MKKGQEKKWEDYIDTVEEQLRRKEKIRKTPMPVSGKSVFRILEQKRRRKDV